LRWCDALVAAGVLALAAFSALALGAVHKWAYTTVEIWAFALLIFWMVQVWREGAAPARISVSRPDLRAIAIPALAFAGLIAIQTAPLPPSFLKTISPATWKFYAISFPGWPAESPFEALRSAWNVKPNPHAPVIRVVLPPVDSSPSRRAEAAAPENAAAARPVPIDKLGVKPLRGMGAWRWKPLAIAPAVTFASLIELLACGAIFFIVLAFPAGFPGAEREANARFINSIVTGVIAIATALALLAIAERASWNGKILWTFVPNDWGVPQLENVRASGPFVNPDHFADFLAMALPLAVVGSVFPLYSARGRRDRRMECMIAAFVIGAALVLSLSRAGWIAAILGITVGLGTSFRRAPDRAPRFLRLHRQRAVPIVVGAIGAGFALLLFVLGPAARSAASARLETVAGISGQFAYKEIAWRDTIPMILNFPLFGVGLGCWPELFPHFHEPPWLEFFYRQPENDYIQLLAETGLAGATLALSFAAVLAARMRSAARGLSERHWPMAAGLGGGVAAVLFHEIFDFSLHTTANAVFFSVILAAFARLVLTHRDDAARKPRTVAEPSAMTWIGSGALAAFAAAMIVAAIIQAPANYPYDIGRPRTFGAAERIVAAHPAVASAHLALAALMPEGAPLAQRESQLRAAVWLDPNDPLARDLYARSLLLSGDKSKALHEITLSVADSPATDTHFYLASRMIPWLLPEEQKAISSGYRRAIASGYGGAVPALATFYGALGRYAEAGRLAEQAARAASDDTERQNDLVEAGRDYAHALDYREAANDIRAAIAIDPARTDPYRALIEAVMGPQGDIKGAQELINAAENAGADPVTLEYALADAANQAGDMNAAEQALADAVKADPSFGPTMRLGGFYMDERKFDQATLAYQRAVNINPDSAEAYFMLAQAEQGDFDYASADRDYAHAVALAPANTGFRAAYRDFQTHTAEAARESPAASPTPASATPSGGAADESAVP
jgi:tetratricopeptide (TPR) repeat protein/O-antigen ligase